MAVWQRVSQALRTAAPHSCSIVLHLPSEPDISSGSREPSHDSKAKEGEAEGVMICDRRSGRTDAASANIRYAPLKLGLSHLGQLCSTMALQDVDSQATPVQESVQKSRVPGVRRPTFLRPLGRWPNSRPARCMHARGRIMWRRSSLSLLGLRQQSAISLKSGHDRARTPPYAPSCGWLTTLSITDAGVAGIDHAALLVTMLCAQGDLQHAVQPAVPPPPCSARICSTSRALRHVAPPAQGAA